MEITISNIKIDVVRKDIKNLHLGVYPPTGRVRIAAPLKVNEEAIRLFAISRFSWIKRNQRKFEEQNRIPQREYKQRESHYFQGRRYLMKIIESESAPKVLLKNKRFLELYVKPNTSTSKRHQIVTKWYRNQLKAQIPPIVDKWEKILKIRISAWQIRQMKTKWGSCNIQRKTLLLNLELAKKPEHCLEYIIVHEMIHLFERHHNEKFLYYMDKHLPNWRKLKSELNSLPIEL